MSTTAITAQDGFDEYYTEKLWSWIPAFYREEDAYTSTPGTLRALVEALGAQAAELRRDIDRMWENSFVELADDEVLETLGALVGTRMVHAGNRRARRVDVARTIRYRRRKGTPRLLETLLTDMTGWGGVHVESRRRLARTYHLLEPTPSGEHAIFTGTPRGGWTNLRSQRIPSLAWTAFDELSHTPDLRRLDGHAGRFGVAKVNVHLHRMRAFSVAYPTVVQIGSGSDPRSYALDPSGREVPLFQPDTRPDSSSWERVREVQLAKAIDRRLLDHNEYEWTADQIATIGAPFAALASYAGWRVPNLRDLERLLLSLSITASASQMVTLMDETMLPTCGRRQLYGDGLALSLAIGADNSDPVEVTAPEIQAGNLANWGTSWSSAVVFDIDKPDSKLVVDPARGAVLAVTGGDALIAPNYHYGFPGEIGAGTYDRRESIVTEGVAILGDGADSPGPVAATLASGTGVDEIQNDKTYFIDDVPLDDVEDYRLQAANFKRPYLVYRQDPMGGTVTWDVTPAAGAGERNLVFDGVWIGLEDTIASAVTSPPASVQGRLCLNGTWDRVEISHCTLDPGGAQMTYYDGGAMEDQARAILYVMLEVAGYIEELVIDSSIIGPIIGTATSVDTCQIGKLTIRDSIVMTTDSTVTEAIDVGLAEVHIERSTIIGNIRANRLYATDTLVTGSGIITDRQNGCFRFSAGVEGEWSRPYESYFFEQFDPAWMTSRRFGDPDLVRLSEVAPKQLRVGAENHCEIGVWNHLLEAVKRTDLRAKLREFMPFDLDMQLVIEN